MNKRPHEDECDDAALLPLVKKPHVTDFSDLLSDKSSSTLDKNNTPEKAKPEGKNLSKCMVYMIHKRAFFHLYYTYTLYYYLNHMHTHTHTSSNIYSLQLKIFS